MHNLHKLKVAIFLSIYTNVYIRPDSSKICQIFTSNLHAKGSWNPPKQSIKKVKKKGSTEIMHIFTSVCVHMPW